MRNRTRIVVRDFVTLLYDTTSEVSLPHDIKDQQEAEHRGDSARWCETAI